MIVNIQKFRDKLESGVLCLGIAITFNDPAVAESLAPAVDFLWIDMEHNPMGVESLLGHLMAARAGGAPALVRVPSTDPVFLKRVLDAGAEGIILPQAHTPEEIRLAVSACRYSPLGNRGWGPRRPSDYGRRSAEQVIREANEALFVSAQIETQGALESLDEIVAIEGLDALVLGPQDLSSALGVAGQVEHPRVLSAIEKVVETAHRAGLSVGTGGGAPAESAVRWARMGIDWIQCGGDFACMNQAAKRLFADVRTVLST